MLGRPLDEVFAYTRSELAHWIAYFLGSPDGPEFADRMNARLCAVIEATRWGNSDPKLNVTGHLLHPANQEAERDRELKEQRDPEKQAQEIAAYVATLNNMRGES